MDPDPIREREKKWIQIRNTGVPMALILDGNSEYIAHASTEKYVFSEKNYP